MFPLNYLEKALVLREIHLRGITAIEQSLKLSSEQNITRSSSEPILHITQQSLEPTLRKASSETLIPRTRITSALTINAIFCRPDETDFKPDPLTKALFNKINEIEAKHGYCPREIKTIDGHYYYTEDPTNILGHYARYYWENEKSKDVVRIICSITNRKGLEEIVKQERISLQQAIRQ